MGLGQGALELGAGPGIAVIILTALDLVPVICYIGAAEFFAAVGIVLSTATDVEASLAIWRRRDS